MSTIPHEVLSAYGLADAEVTAVSGGLINQTFRVDNGAILQRLHPIFGPEVHIDIAAVTAHLADRGMLTPRLLPNQAGELWVRADDGGVWRSLTFIQGTTLHRARGPADVHAAGALVARFHRTLADFDHQYAFARAGVHDTAAHLGKLASLAPTGAPDIRALAADIARCAAALQRPATLPQRHTHGDLKLSNMLFADQAPPQALCLIDLDTLGLQTMDYELGDALRSWCNPQGEDVAAPAVDPALFAAALSGYAQEAPGLLSQAEIAAIVPGLQTVCVELAARFCADAVQDCYFGWDAGRFASRREHNLVRARGQLSLACSIQRCRGELEQATTPLG